MRGEFDLIDDGHDMPVDEDEHMRDVHLRRTAADMHYVQMYSARNDGNMHPKT